MESWKHRQQRTPVFLVPPPGKFNIADRVGRLVITIMQRAKSMKVKEVIECLCKLLSGLGVNSVPSAETFRRAKFNKEDAVPEMWNLLYGILIKAFSFECECSATPKSDPGTRPRLVRWMLFQSGYCAHWLASGEVGSRELLLALGWLLSSGSLLEHLLLEVALGPAALTAMPSLSLSITSNTDPPVTSEGVGEPELGSVKWENGLKQLLWQHGKLTFLRRSLLAAQEERAGLLHQVLSSTYAQHSDGEVHSSSNSAELSKVLEKLDEGRRVMETYLDWKLQETIFWSWMGSVIDARLADPVPAIPEGAVATEPEGAAVGRGCPRAGVEVRGAVEQLGEMLRTLKAELRAVKVEPWATECDDGHDTEAERAQIQERVEARIRSLTEAYRPGVTETPFRAYLQESPAARDPRCRGPPPASACHAAPRGALAASGLIAELRQKEVVLQAELRRLQQADGDAVLEQASEIQGMVLIPPLER